MKMIVKTSLFILVGFILIINKNCVNGIYTVAVMVVKEILFRVVPTFAPIIKPCGSCLF